MVKELTNVVNFIKFTETKRKHQLYQTCNLGTQGHKIQIQVINIFFVQI